MPRDVRASRPKRPSSLSRRSDEELVIRYRNRGDQEAFDEIVHRYEGELYRYLHRYLNDRDLAEDVFQGTFLQLHRKSHLFDEGRAFRPWLYGIATHRAIDALRRRGLRSSASLDQAYADEPGARDLKPLIDVLEAATPSPPDSAEEAERREWARRAVAELPEHLRSTVVLVFFQGLKYTEVAEILNVPLGTVKSRLHTALNKLAEKWKKSELG